MKAAQPFMLMVVQMGSTKRVTRGLMAALSSAERMVTGSVEADDLVKRAMSTAGIIWRKRRMGLMR